MKKQGVTLFIGCALLSLSIYSGILLIASYLRVVHEIIVGILIQIMCVSSLVLARGLMSTKARILGFHGKKVLYFII